VSIPDGPVTLTDRTRETLAQALEVYRGSEHEARLREVMGPARRAAADRDRGPGEGRQVDAAQRAGRRPAGADGRRRVHARRHLVPGRALVRGHALPAGRQAAAGEVPARQRDDRDRPRRPRAEQVDQLVVTWPSKQLRTATLIDTPGIGSLSAQVAKRSWELLATEDEETPADAVVYLLKHLHAQDLEFLRAFHDTEVSRPNPVNAIGVLSGRTRSASAAGLDGVGTQDRRPGSARTRPCGASSRPSSGRRAAGRDAAHADRDRGRAPAQLAALPPREVEELLLSADRFVNSRPELGLTDLEREHLLARFGLFGVRLGSTLLRREVATTATQLARELLRRSGLEDLREVLGRCSCSAATSSRAGRRCSPSTRWCGSTRGPAPTSSAPGSRRSSPGRTRSGSCRCCRRCGPGCSAASRSRSAELERLVGGSGDAAHQRLGLAADASPEELRAAAEALSRWRAAPSTR
jgi:hypothetical protein